MLAFDTDIIADTAQGIWVTDMDGNRWADFACGTAVTNLGHNHPVVVAEAHEQLDKLMHSGCVFRYRGIVELAEALRGITPKGIEKFGFANSGSEAVEAAIKLARYTTKRQGVMAFRGGFHGRTLGSVAYTTSNAKYRDGYHPLLGSVFVAPFPHPYRWGVSELAATERSIDELHLMLKHEVRPHNLAAFLVEPVQGEGGYYPAPAEFLRELAAWPTSMASHSCLMKCRPDLGGLPAGLRQTTTTSTRTSSRSAKVSPTAFRCPLMARASR